MAHLPDWNTVVTIYGREYRTAARLLGRLGPIAPTSYYNVAVMRVANVPEFVEAIIAFAAACPLLLDTVSRIAPLTHVFDFDTVESLQARARDVVLGWVPRLAGASFFVRMHRRGLKDQVSALHEEQVLDRALAAALAETSRPGRVSFSDPDFVIDVEAIDHRAGLALWTRADLDRCPLFRLR